MNERERDFYRQEQMRYMSNKRKTSKSDRFANYIIFIVAVYIIFIGLVELFEQIISLIE